MVGRCKARAADMFRSIRWTLQLWHAGILLVAVAGLGTTLYLTAYKTTFAEVDSELESAARVFAGAPIAQHQPADSPSGIDWVKEMPRDGLDRLGWDERDQPYFIVWSASGSVIRNSDAAPAEGYPGKAPGGVAIRQRGDLREAVMSGPDQSTILVGRSVAREEASLAS